MPPKMLFGQWFPDLNGVSPDRLASLVRAMSTDGKAVALYDLMIQLDASSSAITYSLGVAERLGLVKRAGRSKWLPGDVLET